MREGFIEILSSKALPANWSKRQIGEEKSKQLADSISSIIKQVRFDGDAALIEFAQEFDKVKLTAQTFKVNKEETKEAYRKVSKEQIAALKFMKEKVSSFQKQQLKEIETVTNSDGIIIRTLLKPIESVGCYVPGGLASYPSTLIMTVIPAKIAGVSRIVVVSPSDSNGNINPLVLVAADICGVNEIFKVGGAQAVAALAFGTETIRPVSKIVGPGSKYVTEAKIQVSAYVAIDMPAGPSEVLILADETADADLIAWDMISQAEHGGDSIAGLITTSDNLAKQVQRSVVKIIASSVERFDKIVESLTKHGFIITCRNLEEAVELTNQFAAEHLEVMTTNAEKLADKLVAGLILIGPYSPVPLSDYASGTNHVLPTNKFAESFSGLSVFDFMRRVSVVECSKTGLNKVAKNIKVLTDSENLPNHYKAIAARFDK